jgi:O-antigen/teichoic acid export membrane protein
MLIGNVLLQGFRMVTSVVSARLLGQVQFGELSIINSTVVLFGVFAGLGFGMTATKYVAQSRSQDGESAGRVTGFLLRTAFAVSGLVSLAVLWAAPWIASKVLDAPHLVFELRLSSALIFLNAVNGVQIGALAGLESFRWLAMMYVAQGLLGLPAVAFGAWRFGVPGAIGGTLCVAAFTWLISQWTLRRECQRCRVPLSYRATNKEWAILWQFGLPAALVTLSAQPFSWLVRVYLVNQPDGYAELAILDAAFTWSAILLFLPRQISMPSISILSGLHGARHQDFYRVLRTNLALTMGSALLISIPLMILSPVIMRSYGPSFASSWPVMVLVLAAYAMSAGTMAFRDIIASAGKMWWQSLHTVVWGAVLIGTTLATIERGSLGVAIAYLAAFSTLLIVQGAFLVWDGTITIRGCPKNSPS